MTRSIYVLLSIIVVLCGLYAHLSQADQKPATEVDVTVLAIESDAITLAFADLTPDSGRLSVFIKDLDGKVLAHEKVKFKDGAIQMHIPVEINKETLAEYVVAYRIGDTGAYTQKSLFHLVDQLETIVLMQNRFLSGSTSSARVLARNHRTGQPVADAQVTITFYMNEDNPQNIFEGKTDALGCADAVLAFPYLTGSYALAITVETPFGKDTINESIELYPGYSILLTTDKPMYQPGQVIYIRALALQKQNMMPLVRQPVILEVDDAKGNKVFKHNAETDDFGIVSADFQLATELNQGRFKIRALIDETSQEKTVTVERYVLPKYNVVFTTAKKFYQPGETMKAEIQADYFFGKPVSGGELKIEFSKFDVEFETYATLSGTLDDSGHYSFEQKVPDYFVGQPLDQGQAFVSVTVKVTDKAEHKEQVTKTIPVVNTPIIVAAVPESGALIPQIRNKVYVVTTYPDATPAQTTMQVSYIDPKTGDQAIVHLETDAAGFQSFELVCGDKPVVAQIAGQDSQGNRFSTSIELPATKQTAQTILTRPEKVLYTVGESMRVTLFSTKTQGTAYVDVVRNGQTMLTKTTELQFGTASIVIDLDQTLSGTIAVTGYIISQDGNIVRDSRIVFVDPANDLMISMTSDTVTYLPGQETTIDIAVTDKAGKPALSALGIAVVDEAVFALQEMQPGMEKIYFYLEKELLTPRYEIHGYHVEDVVRPQPEQQPQTREQAAAILFAAAEEIGEWEINVNTYERDNKGQAYQKYVSEKLNNRYHKIARAFNKFSEKANKRQKKYLQKIDWDETKPVTLEKLVELRYLTQADITDPWGNVFVVEGDWSRVYVAYFDFTLISLGPDGIKDTEDDVHIQQYLPGRADRMDFDFKMMRRGGMMKGEGMVLMAEPEAMMFEDAAVPAKEMGGGADDAAPQVRIRKYFPETLYFNPAVISDAKGKASIKIPLADSITTWRLTSLASSINGALGSATFPIRVFQEFFIDIDFPISLTQNDEVSVPIAIYNYLPRTQKILLRAQPEAWFTMLDEEERLITVQPNEVTVQYFTLKVKTIGTHTFTVTGYGEKRSDAIMRSIEVEPDGKEYLVTETGRIEGVVNKTIAIPEAAIADASKIFVKIYPGVFSQVVEGMDNLLRMPFGCFEQTSSVTYPNVLVLNYMKATENITPEIQMKAEGFINTGYQRLLSYEVDGGGFSWFGDAPAHNVLTAYGLMEFSDMSKVYEIDRNVIRRTQQWLASLQQPDGSWKPTEGGIAEGAIDAYKNDVLRTSAYIMLALTSTDYKGAETVKGAQYIQQHINDIKDNFTLAMCTYAFTVYQPHSETTAQLIKMLLDRRTQEDELVYWKAQAKTSMYGRGDAADIETTALACQALLLNGKHSLLVSKINNYLIQKKDPHGTWGTTQATVQALKALLMSIEQGTQRVDGAIQITMNDQPAQKLTIDETNDELLQIVDLKYATRTGNNQISITLEGEGSMFYQIVGRYYLPHQPIMRVKQPMSIEVAYDKSELKQNDMVTCSVTVTNNRPATADMIIVDLGMPPGFDLIASDLSDLVQKQRIKKFDRTGRQIIIYFDEIKGLETIEFSYRLQAKFPLKAKTTESRVYEYYDPSVSTSAPPQSLVVTK